MGHIESMETLHIKCEEKHADNATAGLEMWGTLPQKRPQNEFKKGSADILVVHPTMSTIGHLWVLNDDLHRTREF